jgi:flagellar hook-associated protein 1 FlgK
VRFLPFGAGMIPMLAYSIAQSALNVSEQVLELIGENLANVNTPGYQTQTANLSEVISGGIGDGVTVGSITNDDSPLVDTAVRMNTYETSSTSAQLQTLQQIQAYLTPGTSSLDTQISQFLSDVTTLTADPSNTAQSQAVVGDLSGISGTINNLADSLDQLRVSVGNQASNDVSQVNQLAPQIASLNGQIQNLEIQGQSANNLIDQRDELINQLAQYVDVRTVAQPYGVTNVVGAGVPLVDSNQSYGLQYGTDSSGNIDITALNSPLPVNLNGGELQGLVQMYNQTIPSYSSQLNTLVGALAQQVDGVQATGIGSGGPLTVTNGTRGVSSATATLDDANTEFPIQAGTLNVSVTDLSTGQVTLDPVAIDPTTQSLQDVATAITTATGGQVQVSVDTANNTLQFQAQSGYAFDFAGQPPTTPTFSGNYAGTTTSTLSGAYTGAANDTYTFQVEGAGGTVGTTPGLTVQVLDGANNVVATLDVGSDYTPGTALTVANGVSVAFSAGTFTAGSFSYPVTSQPDTSGLLIALGINTAFTGSTGEDLAVNPTLLANPSALSTSLTGESGDSSNLQRLLTAMNQPVLDGGTQTIQQYYDGIVGTVGTQVQLATSQQTAQQALGQQLQTQQQSVSGVDQNTQLLDMLSFQQAYQLAASYVSAVNTAYDALVNITL